MICRFCGKRMKEIFEGYESIYTCECEPYWKEQKLRRQLRLSEMDQKDIVAKLQELEDNSDLSKAITAVNEKFETHIMTTKVR